MVLHALGDCTQPFVPFTWRLCYHRGSPYRKLPPSDGSVAHMIRLDNVTKVYKDSVKALVEVSLRSAKASSCSSSARRAPASPR